MGSQRVGHDWATFISLHNRNRHKYRRSDYECVRAQWLQSCPTLCDSMDHSLPGSSGHRIFPAKMLEWVVMLSSKGSSWPRDGTRISCTADWFFTTEAPGVFMWVKILICVQTWTYFLRSTGRAQILSFWIPLFTERNKGYLKNTAYCKDGARKVAKTSLG